MSNDDLYKTLEVSPAADLEAIRAAYRRLARRYHPDLNPRPEAAERMRAINAAYGLLSDPARRAVYDAQRYLPQSRLVTVAGGPRVRPVVVWTNPTTPLQRRVDRIVAVLGVLLVAAIGLYAVTVIPNAERQFQSQTDPRLAPVAGAAGASASGTGVPASTVAPAADHAISSAVPDRLRLDGSLHDFPGTVLVAPTTLVPFAGLPILHLDVASRGIARYAVYYGDLTTGGASISGLVGRDAFDAGAPPFADCAADAAYCSGPVGGQPPGGPPGLELFRAPNLVESLADQAYVTHRVCCNGVFWSVSWYDSKTNMSYTIDLSRSIAAQYGHPRAEADTAAAKAVSALATQLVRLP